VSFPGYPELRNKEKKEEREGELKDLGASK